MYDSLCSPLPRHRRRLQGQGLVEYALILVLVAVVVIFVLGILGGATRQPFADAYCTIKTGQQGRAFTVMNGGPTYATLQSMQANIYFESNKSNFGCAAITSSGSGWQATVAIPYTGG